MAFTSSHILILQITHHKGKKKHFTLVKKKKRKKKADFILYNEKIVSTVFLKKKT